MLICVRMASALSAAIFSSLIILESVVFVANINPLMANCHVLEANQKPTDRPSRRIKRSGGQSLVRQMKAYWITENVLLQMLDLRSLAPRQRIEQPAAVFIPDSMPPVIDKRLGVRFEDPIKAPAMPRFRRIWSGEKYNQPMLPNGDSASL